MTNLERRALLGDAEAQRECMEKEILLPCPFCGNTNIRTSNWGMWRCWCPKCRAKSDDCLRERDAIRKWNVRPAPPIGRCVECAERNTGDGDFCFYGSEDDFCSGFIPKCGDRMKDKGGEENVQNV